MSIPWQIAQIGLSVLMLERQISAFSDYASKLKILANQIDTWADEDKVNYQALRAHDIDF